MQATVKQLSPMPMFFDKDPFSSSSNRSSVNKKPLPLPSSVSPHPTTTDATEDDNTDNKYDAVYYTKEPLPRRARSDFPEKTMDVDIDVKTFKVSTGRPSQL